MKDTASTLERKNGRIYFSMFKWKAGIALRRFQRVFSERTFRNNVALQWKQIRKKGKPSDGNFWHFLFSPIKVTFSTVVWIFIYGSYYLLHLLSWFFLVNLEKMISEKYQLFTIFLNYSIISLNPLAKIWSVRGACHTQLWIELPDLKPHVLVLST